MSFLLNLLAPRSLLSTEPAVVLSGLCGYLTDVLATAGPAPTWRTLAAVAAGVVVRRFVSPA